MTNETATRESDTDKMQAQLDRVHAARARALMLAEAVVDAQGMGLDLAALVGRLGAALTEEKQERQAFNGLAAEHHRRLALEKLADIEKRRQHERSMSGRLEAAAAH